LAVTARAESFVEFDRVQKSYDGATLVVKDLNLSIAKGEFLTMLGPSGSGKTTCLMMLAGFETATSGEIRLDGRPINQVPPHKRGIGMVFQNYALFPHMTVAENLSFPLEVRGMARPEREAKIARALDMVQMGGFGSRRPAQLSGGQQQRLVIARTVAVDPDIILMDEPCSALDPIATAKIEELIDELRSNYCIIIVTHSMAQAARVSQKTAFFHMGRLVETGATEEIFTNPRDTRTQDYITGRFG